MMHTMTEKKEPIGATSPICHSVSGNMTEAIYEPGTRISRLDMTLWAKESPASRYAQK